MARDNGRDQPVHRITAAREPHSAELARRTQRYLVQMTIRVVCFLGAVIVDHWIRWVLLVGAVVLPYVAVVLANAGSGPGEDPGTFVQPRHLEGPARTDDETDDEDPT